MNFVEFVMKGTLGVLTTVILRKDLANTATPHYQVETQCHTLYTCQVYSINNRGFIRSQQPAKTAAYFVSHGCLLSPVFVDLIKKKLIRSPPTLASSDGHFKNY